MYSEQYVWVENVGRAIGFALSYAIFTTILYFVWSYAKGLPEGMTVVHVAGITALITVSGVTIRRLLR